ncbi:MAG: ATP synthase F0 subunit B [bacterium]|nr:ATP synthase F0 subunit B [bacterium]
MESIISTFHIDWKIIIAQAINFAAVFVVLYIFALKPLGKLMAERSEKIGKGIEDAKKSNELLQKATFEYEENTRKLRKLSMDSEQQLQKDLEKLRIENLERIKSDNEEWMKQRKEQLEVDKKTLVESAKNELASLAILAAEKIIAEKNK